MCHMWRNVTSGLLTAHIKLIQIKPDQTSGLLKARVVGRRIYDSSEFQPVNDPHCKWATISALMTSGLFGTIKAQSHFWPIKGPCFYGSRYLHL